MSASNNLTQFNMCIVIVPICSSIIIRYQITGEKGKLEKRTKEEETNLLFCEFKWVYHYSAIISPHKWMIDMPDHIAYDRL